MMNAERCAKRSYLLFIVHHSAFIIAFLCFDHARSQAKPITVRAAADDVDIYADATEAIDAHVREVFLQEAHERLIAARGGKLRRAFPIGFGGGGAEEVSDALCGNRRVRLMIGQA